MTTEHPPAAMDIEQKRIVRVFVSSTFRDMHAERDLLVRQVFPRLRKLCWARGVELVDVDLRWGLSEEEVAAGAALEACLDEVRRCRPFFIGLLGERYGWIPGATDVSATSVSLDAWEEGLSITELEIRRGVLEDPAMASRALFYFRDSSSIEELSPSEHDDYVSSDAGARRRLESLKEDIRGSGVSLHDGFRDAQELGALVYRDLLAIIDDLFPVDATPDLTKREEQEQAAYMAQRRDMFVGRERYLRTLDELLVSGGRSVVLHGPSGLGKSALLSQWLAGIRVEPSPPACFMHFMGGSSQSAGTTSIVRRLLIRLRQIGQWSEPIPEQAWRARALVRPWLAKAATSTRVVIVLDALDKLEDGGAALLESLPSAPLDTVLIVVSTTDMSFVDRLAQRGWVSVALEPLSPSEREEATVRYLRRYRKAMRRSQLERIAISPATASTLFLRVLLQELRVFGIFDELDERFDALLDTASIGSLYQRVLERIERDLGPERSALLKRAATLLCVAQRGLSEAEIFELLGPGGAPLPAAHWIPLRVALDDTLFEHGGRMRFLHDHIHEAVEARYLPDTSALGEAHAPLASLARAWSDPELDAGLREYALSHGSFHLHAIGDDEGLFELAMDDGYIAEQYQLHGSSTASRALIERAIDLHAVSRDPSATADARLARLALRAQSLGRRSSEGTAEIFELASSGDLDHPGRAHRVLTALEPLAPRKRVRVALLLAWEEAARQRQRTERSVDPHLCERIVHLMTECTPDDLQMRRGLPGSLLGACSVDLLWVLSPSDVARLIAMVRGHSGFVRDLLQCVDRVVEDGLGSGLPLATVTAFLEHVHELVVSNSESVFTTSEERACRIPAMLAMAHAIAGDFERAFDRHSRIEDREWAIRSARSLCVACLLADDDVTAARLMELLTHPGDRARCEAFVAAELALAGRPAEAMSWRASADAVFEEGTRNGRDRGKLLRELVITAACLGLQEEATARFRQLPSDKSRSELVQAWAKRGAVRLRVPDPTARGIISRLASTIESKEPRGWAQLELERLDHLLWTSGRLGDLGAYDGPWEGSPHQQARDLCAAACAAQVTEGAAGAGAHWEMTLESARSLPPRWSEGIGHATVRSEFIEELAVTATRAGCNVWARRLWAVGLGGGDERASNDEEERALAEMVEALAPELAANAQEHLAERVLARAPRMLADKRLDAWRRAAEASARAGDVDWARKAWKRASDVLIEGQRAWARYSLALDALQDGSATFSWKDAERAFLDSSEPKLQLECQHACRLALGMVESQGCGVEDGAALATIDLLECPSRRLGAFVSLADSLVKNNHARAGCRRVLERLEERLGMPPCVFRGVEFRTAAALWWKLGERSRAWKLIERMEDETKRFHDLSQARGVRTQLARYCAARDEAGSVDALLEGLDGISSECRSRSMIIRGILHQARGDVYQASRSWREAAALALAQREQAVKRQLFEELATTATEHGFWDLASEFCRQLDSWDGGRYGKELCCELVGAGERDLAEQQLRVCTDRIEDSEVVDLLARVGHAWLQQGDEVRARACLGDAIERLGRLEEARSITHQAGALCRQLERCGRPDDIRAIVARHHAVFQGDEWGTRVGKASDGWAREPWMATYLERRAWDSSWYRWNLCLRPFDVDNGREGVRAFLCALVREGRLDSVEAILHACPELGLEEVFARPSPVVAKTGLLGRLVRWFRTDRER